MSIPAKINARKLWVQEGTQWAKSGDGTDLVTGATSGNGDEEEHQDIDSLVSNLGIWSQAWKDRFDIWKSTSTVGSEEWFKKDTKGCSRKCDCLEESITDLTKACTGYKPGTRPGSPQIETGLEVRHHLDCVATSAADLDVCVRSIDPDNAESMQPIMMTAIEASHFQNATDHILSDLSKAGGCLSLMVDKGPHPIHHMRCNRLIEVVGPRRMTELRAASFYRRAEEVSSPRHSSTLYEIDSVRRI